MAIATADSARIRIIDQESQAAGFHSAVSFSEPDQRTSYSPSAVEWRGRQACREIARQTPEAEIEVLFKKHRTLAYKAALGEASDHELLDLELVRWELEAIEDARNAVAHDVMQLVVEQNERFAEQLERYVQRLDSVKTSNPRKGRRR